MRSYFYICSDSFIWSKTRSFRMTSAYMTDGAKTAKNNLNLMMCTCTSCNPCTVHLKGTVHPKKKLIIIYSPSCHSKHYYLLIYLFFCGTMEAYTRQKKKKLHKNHKAVHMICNLIALRDKENSQLASHKIVELRLRETNKHEGE